MTIHLFRQLDIITTIEQYRRDAIITTDRRNPTITTSIMVIAIDIAISSDLIAINRSDHLRRSVIMDHLIMGHLTSVAHLLSEVVDKKYNEI